MRSVAFFCFSVLLVHTASAQPAPGCPNGNATLNGVYAFVATQTLASDTPPPAAGSVFSNTEVGRLMSGILNGASFAGAGVFTLDGDGHIAASASAQGGLNEPLGTYNVNASDCTIVAALTDIYGTNTTSSNLMGLVMNAGAEVALGLAPSASSQVGSSLLIRLVRPLYSFGCSVADLNGAYGLVAQVTFQAVPISPPATGNIATLARVRFDGTGNILTDQVTSKGSPLSLFQYVGTYAINADCSGTMTLTTGSTPGSPAGQPISVSFALTPPILLLGFPNMGSNPFRPGIEFAVSNSNQTVSGYGRPQ